jgi:hypothetical protein
LNILKRAVLLSLFDVVPPLNAALDPQDGFRFASIRAKAGRKNSRQEY